ncbi:MAG: hypothetical protein LCH54_05540 [Bacteroidetes bacterium]|nr:hypothetical protein [Bacteroidota bacterium]
MKNVFLFFIFLVLVSCKQDSDTGEIPPEVSADPGIYILNEGLWGQNNSSLQFFSLISGTVAGDLKTGVLGEPLGDTGNSMSTNGSLGLISVTSSNKLVWFDLKSGKKVKSYKFPAEATPRESLIGPDGNLYISSFYQHQVLVINSKTDEVVNKIPVDSYPENLAADSDNLYVSCNGLGSGQTLMKIPFLNPDGKTKITVPQNPDKIMVVSDGILVFCLGNLWDAKPQSRIVKIENGQNSVSKSFDAGMQIQSVCEYGTTKLAVTTSEAVFVINSDLVVTDTLINRKSVLFKGKILSQTIYDPKKDWFWVTSTDAYTVRGWLEAFHKGTRVAGPVQVGLNPGSLLVKP